MERLPRGIEFLLLFFAGSCITLSLAPFDYWPLALLALFLLHHALIDVNAATAARRGWFFGCGMFFSGTFWIYISIHEHGSAPAPLAAFLTGSFCLFMSLWLVPFAWLYARRYSTLPFGSSLAFAAIWLLSEWVRLWLLTGFPWLFVGYSQLDGPLQSLAPVVGTLGIGFLLAYTAATLSRCLHRKKTHPHLLLVALFWLAPLAIGNIEWTEPKGTKTYSVAMVQPDVHQAIKWKKEFRDKILQDILDTTEKLGHHDIVIWPETAIPEIYQHVFPFLEELDELARTTDTAMVVGVPTRWYNGEQAIYHNSLITLGNASGIYHKQKLVPFGEYVPMEKSLRGLIRFFDLPMSSFHPGPPDQEPMEVKDLLLMPNICYEVVYPDFVSENARQADLLLTVSNDAWFGDSIGPIQHMQIARMRALENGRYLLRDTNNGITAVVDHHGKVVASLPRFSRGILEASVEPRQGLTPIARYGTLPAVLFSFAILLLLPGRHARKLLPQRR